MFSQFPHETYIEIKDEKNFMGRVIVSKTKKGFNAEIDIVHVETKKILKHVADIFDKEGPQEVYGLALTKLSNFLKGLPI